MLDVWRKILGVNTIGLEENFFEIGGNSLSSITLMRAIHEEFHVESGTFYLLAYSAGAYFPVNEFPVALQYISYLVPYTWGYDLVRYYSLIGIGKPLYQFNLSGLFWLDAG